MSKNKVLPKKFRKAIRKNPYTAGITTALVALGGIAAIGMRNGDIRERGRALKDSLMRKISSARPALVSSAHAAAAPPF